MFFAYHTPAVLPLGAGGVDVIMPERALTRHQLTLIGDLKTQRLKVRHGTVNMLVLGAFGVCK